MSKRSVDPAGTDERPLKSLKTEKGTAVPQPTQETVPSSSASSSSSTSSASTAASAAALMCSPTEADFLDANTLLHFLRRSWGTDRIRLSSPPPLSGPPIGQAVFVRTAPACAVLKQFFNVWKPKGPRGPRTPLVATQGAPGVGKSLFIDLLVELFGGQQIISTSFRDEVWTQFVAQNRSNSQLACEFRDQLKDSICVSVTLNDRQKILRPKGFPTDDAAEKFIQPDCGEQAVAARILHSYVRVFLRPHPPSIDIACMRHMTICGCDLTERWSRSWAIS
jgi:hypothetical protein